MAKKNKQQTAEEFFNELTNEAKTKRRKEKLFVKKNQFEDVSGFNTISFCSLTEENPTEFVILTTGPEGKELAVSLISKSDIPRMIRELTKLF